MKDHSDKSPRKKENARKHLLYCLWQAQNARHLSELLRAAQFQPYIRGRTPGVIDTATARKYRLNTLGLDREGQETVKRLRADQPQQERTQARLRNIEDLKLLKVQRLWLRLGFREEIVETLRADQPAGRRERDITRTKQAQRRRERARGFDDRFPALGREKTLEKRKP